MPPRMIPGFLGFLVPFISAPCPLSRPRNNPNDLYVYISSSYCSPEGWTWMPYSITGVGKLNEGQILFTACFVKSFTHSHTLSFAHCLCHRGEELWQKSRGWKAQPLPWEVFLFPALLGCHWHRTLCKFKVYQALNWYTCIAIGSPP